jgi:hypothetical protein
MRRRFVALAVLTIVLIALFAGVLLAKYEFSGIADRSPQVYVGVTYGGDSVAQGKLLIDKVRDYSNLFVLQSGLLQRDFRSVEELGDYAISAGMYFLPYFGVYIPSTFSAWLESAKQKWGIHLLGIYYRDEPGGKMLDDYVQFSDNSTGDSITKTKYGDIFVQKSNGVAIQYGMTGVIKLYEQDENDASEIANEATFYSNGSIQIVKSSNGLNDFSYKSYQELTNIRPFKDLNDTSQRFVDRDRSNINFLKMNSTKVFTSDYALYWFDYLSGYDVILSQIGWNLSLNQQIALLRGAATLQNKDWGIVITWKYQQPPYLDNGTEILNQMRTAYQCGAKYFVLFNYYDSNSSTYGTLKEEHFQALKSFWNSVVKNPQVAPGSVKADSVLVLPENYGWGTRWETDKIWGIFSADERTQQLWTLIQKTIQDHGLNMDIIYEDKDFTLPAFYQNIHRNS